MCHVEKTKPFSLPLLSSEDAKWDVVALLTKQVVSGQSVEDARGPDEVAHGSGEGGGVDPDGNKGVPDVDVSKETVIPLQEDTVGESAPRQYFRDADLPTFGSMQVFYWI